MLQRIDAEIWKLSQTDDLEPELRSSPNAVDFEIAFRRPTLVSRRYPIQFGTTELAQLNDISDDWRRHLVFYLDFLHRLDDFKLLCEEDQIFVARSQIVQHGWLMHAYYTMINNVVGLSYVNNRYHPRDGIIKGDSSTKCKDQTKIYATNDKGNEENVKKKRENQLSYQTVINAKTIFETCKGETKDQVRLIREKYIKALYSYIQKYKTQSLDEAVSRLGKFMLILATITVCTFFPINFLILL
ncbi:unnamed protein product [Enterobius vermicularis]|uniref:NR LBD domain-containing protein n=1 Tax=Enterobius vermicularis TaxID=51028 RepID=A0A0N4UY07_ENTVE|nr:unnamed protein product [Enterobius vermicularis]